jgi:hypothetical protein
MRPAAATARSPAGAGRVAAAVVAIAAGLAFMLPLLAPLAPALRRPDALRVGDAEGNGRIVSLVWTGDRSRLIAVTQRGATTSAVAVSADGSRLSLAGPVRAEILVFPAPQGTRIAVARMRDNQRTLVSVVDARVGRDIWWRWSPGRTSVSWRPDGALALVASAAQCRLVESSDGQTVRQLAAPAGGVRSTCP